MATMIDLADWPEHRRQTLLRRLGDHYDYTNLANLVIKASGGECNWRWIHVHEPVVAVLGDDSRYHLQGCNSGALLCTEQPTAETQQMHRAELYPHQRVCTWWTDGTHYRLAAPRSGASGDAGQARVDWVVRLHTTTLDPTEVPHRERCHFLSGRSHWPPYADLQSELGRLRQKLRGVAGNQCHACGLRVGTVIDHDHCTGLVRGLLCTHCNAWIDACPHLTDCKWAEYLNNPPAAHLGASHPKPRNERRRRRRN